MVQPILNVMPIEKRSQLYSLPCMLLVYMCEYTEYHIIFFRINRNLFCSYKVWHRIIDTRYAKGNIILLSEVSNIKNRPAR